MKIAIINRHPSDASGGSEIQCDGIATRLTNNGHNVSYIAPAGKTTHNYNKNYKVIPVDNSAEAIAEATIKTKPEIVYWRFNKYFLYKSAKIIAQKKIPIVFAISNVNDTKLYSHRENFKHGLISILKGVKQSLLNLYNWMGLKYISGVTANNPDHINLLPNTTQCFIPNSIDTNLVQFSWPRPYVIWVANIKPAKRPELYVKLAKDLANMGVDFLMVGKIQDNNYSWIENENSRTPSFHYLGSKSLEQVNGIIANSLFLAHTCKPEGFPGVFIQSWLFNKPTVTFEFDPGFYIENNKLGGNAKSNWDTYKNTVKELIEDDDARDDIGQRAKIFATSNFSSEQTTEKLEKFLETILKKAKDNDG